MERETTLGPFAAASTLAKHAGKTMSQHVDCVAHYGTPLREDQLHPVGPQAHRRKKIAPTRPLPARRKIQSEAQRISRTRKARKPTARKGAASARHGGRSQEGELQVAGIAHDLGRAEPEGERHQRDRGRGATADRCRRDVLRQMQRAADACRLAELQRGVRRDPQSVGPRPTPGGSSGGSAAALAAGLTGIDAGSDIGSSIRNPAHYCGVFGHKPTYGLITMRGHALPNAVAPADISVIGPLARSAADLETALDIMAGPDPDDGGYMKVALPKCEKTSLKQFRVAVKLTDPASDVDGEYADQLQNWSTGSQRPAARSRKPRPTSTPPTERHLHPPSARRDLGAHAGIRHRVVEERVGKLRAQRLPRPDGRRRDRDAPPLAAAQ